jgi:hypothetical protein
MSVSTQKNQNASKGCQLKKATPKMGIRLKTIINRMLIFLFILLK